VRGSSAKVDQCIGALGITWGREVTVKVRPLWELPCYPGGEGHWALLTREGKGGAQRVIVTALPAPLRELPCYPGGRGGTAH